MRRLCIRDLGPPPWDSTGRRLFLIYVPRPRRCPAVHVPPGMLACRHTMGVSNSTFSQNGAGEYGGVIDRHR